MTTETERAFMPHIWVQPTGFGPKVWAGEITDGNGRPYRGVRFAPQTKAGFDELMRLLQTDINRLTGAA